MTVSVCCICHHRHNRIVRQPHRLRASGRDASKLNQQRADPKRNCIYHGAAVFPDPHNLVAICSVLGHRTHHVHHRCMWTTFWHWKRVALNQPDQRATINYLEKLLAFGEREAAEDVVAYSHQAVHRIDIPRKLKFEIVIRYTR